MPPKLSAGSFNRIIAITGKTLEILENNVSTLERLTAIQAKGQADFLSEKLCAELETFDSAVTPYLVTENLCEGLSEPDIQAWVSELREKFCSLQCTVARYLTLVPMAQSTQWEGATISGFNSSNIILPKLKFNKFSGNYADFDAFLARFETLVHKNPSLSNCDKFEYLLTHLEGIALDVVKHFPFTEQNYESALEVLKERFSNGRRAMSFHSNSILNLPNIVNSVESIRFFLDQHQVHMASLENFLRNLPEIHAQDVVYVQFILSKFSKGLRDQFELESAKLDSISLDVVTEFLKRHVRALENASLGTVLDCGGNVSSSSYFKASTTSSRRRPLSASKSDKNVNFSSLSVSCIECFACSSTDHKILNCDEFKSLSPKKRFKLAKSKDLCVRCLLSTHKGNCPVAGGCRTCQSKSHHTLLHFGKDTMEQVEPARPVIATPEEPANAVCTATIFRPPAKTTVLMSTALVRLQVSSSKFLIVRAILDSASHVSFVTENLVQSLGCPRFADSISVTGIGRSSTPTKGKCVLSVCTVKGKVVVPTHDFHILPVISGDTPREQVSPAVIEAARCFMLADPTFHLPSRVDALLGADILASALLGSVTPLGVGLPVVMLSVFGAVLCGSAPTLGSSECDSVPPACQISCHENPWVSLVASPTEDLVEMVNRFWSVEEPPVTGKPPSPEAVLCGTFFNETTTRLDSGRYQVRLPFLKGGQDLLGDSHSNARRRLHSLERKFKSDSNFKNLYIEFMADYLAKGHMKEVADPSFPCYFIPHHGIYKSHGDRSKIRVVFDASAKTSSNRSLNSILLDTPNVMTLLSDILTLFRVNRYVFTCDIEQMYRQVVMHPEDTRYQCILWREDEELPIRVFCLCTLTYGVGPSAFQAISVLRRLAEDESFRFPKAAQILLRKTFVDDIGAGSDSIESALQLRDELISLLAAGGFTLKKWSSNSQAVLAGIPPDYCSTGVMTRVLGLVWDLKNDTLKFPVEEMIVSSDITWTKRLILAQTARLYDPCGFISPIVMYAKHFIQILWRSSLDWDTPVPTHLASNWIRVFHNALHHLGNISVPRALAVSKTVQLHAFGDASQSGYSAILYLRSSVQGKIVVTLLASRTKVAPLRVISVPRLELLAAHLTARLVNHYVHVLSSELLVEKIFAWSDSSIVLDWIRIEPYLLKTFVANRVADIRDWTKVESWRHVPGVLNPADMASRGIPSFSAEEASFWLEGPPFLLREESHWPAQPNLGLSETSELELRSNVMTMVADLPKAEDLFSHISVWSRAVRISACIARWRYHRHLKEYTPLKLREWGLRFLIRYIQMSAFSEDLAAMANNQYPRPAVQRLAPFVDSEGILRIKGRLVNAQACKTCPVLLPKDHRLVHLLIRHYHIWLGHAGPSQVQFQLSLTYWILSARQVVRKIIHQCVKCFRTDPRPCYPLMGDLPSVRVNPAPPFLHSGMDYCGPFFVKPYALRKAPVIKAYLCIFVCMVTKAVHIEVAHDLSTQAFLDVLKRFIARRGVPAKLFSDCGTNFLGARSVLCKELRSLLLEHASHKEICSYLLENDIDFVTIPPSAPHQGGLWERAVRSAKFHLKRVIGPHVLVLSQFITLSTMVEAILNSRPLTPMSSEAGDLSVLTPAHFLIGRPLTLPPEHDLSQESDGSLRHYHLIQAMMQRFWAQWKLEYLSTLQARSKWTKKSSNLMVGDIVVLSEPNSPPMLWPLARVKEVIPGRDGVVRRVLITNRDGTYDRPAVKVYRLPIEATN